MSDWKEENLGAQAALRMLRRACRARGVESKTTDQHLVTGARYRTDGIATLAVVTIIDCRAASDLVYGYGVSVRAVEDDHNEHFGANLAIRRAMECAATVVAHRCEDRRLRASFVRRLEMAELVVGSMRALFAESEKEAARS